MATFQLRAPARLFISRFLAWNAQSPRLMSPEFLRTQKRFESRRFDAQIVSEFRGKLRQTEDLISKLGYNLRELNKMHR